MRSIQLLVTSLFVAAVFIPNVVLATTLGITPPSYDFGIINSGDTRTGSFTLVRGSDDVFNAVTIEVVGTGEEFVYIPERIEYPEGERLLAVDYEVQPTEEANGEYHAAILVTPVLEVVSSEENTQQLVTGVHYDLTFETNTFATVSYEYAVGSYEQTEEGVHASFFIENTGDALWTPDEVVFTLQDAAGEVVDQFALRDESVNPIQPEQTTEYAADFSETNEEESYTVAVEVKKDDASVITEVLSADAVAAAKRAEKKITFQNATIQETVAGTFQSIERNVLLFTLGAAFVLVCILIVIVDRWRRKKKVMKKQVHKPVKEKKKPTPKKAESKKESSPEKTVEKTAKESTAQKKAQKQK